MSPDYKNPYDLLLNGNTNKDPKEFEISKLHPQKSEFVSPMPKPKQKMLDDDKPKSSNILKEMEIKPSKFDETMKNRYTNLKFLHKIKRLLMPFSSFYTNEWVLIYFNLIKNITYFIKVISDCFFFPQRYLASCLMGACSVAYFSYLFFTKLQDIFQMY